MKFRAPKSSTSRLGKQFPPAEANRGGTGSQSGNSLVDKPKKTRYGVYTITDAKLRKRMKTETDEYKEVSIANRMEIVELRQDIDTNQVLLSLSYTYRGRDLTTEIPRGMLTRLKLLELLDIGVDVRETNVKDILAFLRLQEENAPLSRYHSTLGWGQWEGAPIFKHHMAIGCDSVYRGPLRIESKGTLEKWAEIIREQVLGHTPLELALVAGLSAVVSSLVARETAMEVIIIHVYGDSSIGKTTAARVAVSPFGFPHTQNGGLIHSWNGTTNAVMGLISNSHGFPLCFDEASMKGGDFTTLIYMLAAGKDKVRLTKEAHLRAAGEWSGTVISTAEHSLTAKAKQNIGVQMRLLELGNMPWTRSAANADALKAGLMQNYGHAGPVFVRHLMDIGSDAVLQSWRAWHDALLRESDPADPFASRLSAKLAVLLSTAELANAALGLELNVEAIRDLLTQSVADTVRERDLGLKAYETFQECVVRYQGNFARPHSPFEGRELWGQIVQGRHDRGEKVYVLPGVFAGWMEEAGFEDVSVILQLWRDRGWLDAEKGHLTRKKKLDDKETRVYAVKLPSSPKENRAGAANELFDE